MDYEAYLLQTYGPRVAQRYRQVCDNRPSPRTEIHTERWTSNTLHRHKHFTPVQCAVIRSHHAAGYTCRQLAREWGVSQGTISNVLVRRGAYR